MADTTSAIAIPKPEKVVLSVNGREWSGWKSVRITRGVERCPSDFTVIVTELYPDTPGIDIQPGQPVVVKSNGDLLITGFVDRYSSSMDSGSHEVEISGRGRCEDLVDCSALFNGMQISQSTTLGVAQIVTDRFGIKVTSLDGPGDQIPQCNSVLTETPYQIIERLTRVSGLLAYEDTTGNMVLARAGKTGMASGFKQGVNVQAARYTYGIDQRFHNIQVVSNSVDQFWQLAQAPPRPVGISVANSDAIVTDEAIREARIRIIVSEQGFAGLDLSIRRANWEKARRMGRSYAVTVTTDTWRDRSGNLWEPNATVTLDLPALKVPSNLEWVISEVNYLQDITRGTVAEVTIMPHDAFNPEPINLFPIDKQVDDELRNGEANLYAHRGDGRSGVI